MVVKWRYYSSDPTLPLHRIRQADAGSKCILIFQSAIALMNLLFVEVAFNFLYNRNTVLCPLYCPNFAFGYWHVFLDSFARFLSILYESFVFGEREVIRQRILSNTFSQIGIFFLQLLLRLLWHVIRNSFQIMLISVSCLENGALHTMLRCHSTKRDCKPFSIASEYACEAISARTL